MLSFELLELSYVCLRVVTKYPLTSILNVFICIYILTRITHKPECYPGFSEIQIKGRNGVHYNECSLINSAERKYPVHKMLNSLRFVRNCDVSGANNRRNQ